MVKKKLKLAKTNDYCAFSKPRLSIVMIHGIASNSGTYGSALDYFRSLKELGDVRFVTFDLLGSGESLSDDGLNYDYDEQIEALHNSIAELKIDTPLVLVGHSLGTFIVTRYAAKYPDEVARLILVSAPIYLESDFDNPTFMMGIELFKNTIGAREPEIVKGKAFINSMDNIVLNRKNYSVLAQLATPTTLIYGAEDQLIASHNIPRLLKENSSITAIRTDGGHGVTKDKYTRIAKLLEEYLDEIL